MLIKGERLSESIHQKTLNLVLDNQQRNRLENCFKKEHRTGAKADASDQPI